MKRLAVTATLVLIALVSAAPERALTQTRQDSLIEVMNYPEMHRLLEQVNRIAPPGTSRGSEEDRMELFGHILRQQQQNIGPDPTRQARFTAMVHRIQEVALVWDFFSTASADLQIPDAGQFSEPDALLLGTLKQTPMFNAFQRGFGGDSSKYAQTQSHSIYPNTATQPIPPQNVPPGGLSGVPAPTPQAPAGTPAQNWLNGNYTWKQTLYDKDTKLVHRTEACVATVTGTEITIRYSYADPYEKWHLDAKLIDGRVETYPDMPGWAKIYSNPAYPPLGHIDGTYTKEMTNGQTDRFIDPLDGGTRQYFEFFGPVDGVAYYGHFAADRVRWNTESQDWERRPAGVRCAFDPRVQSEPGREVQVTVSRQ